MPATMSCSCALYPRKRILEYGQSRDQAWICCGGVEFSATFVSRSRACMFVKAANTRHVLSLFTRMNRILCADINMEAHFVGCSRVLSGRPVPAIGNSRGAEPPPGASARLFAECTRQITTSSCMDDDSKCLVFRELYRFESACSLGIARQKALK